MSNPAASYMLIFRDATPEAYEAMTAAQRQTCLDDWNAWYDSLAARGVMQDGHPLKPAGRVVSGIRGERVLDGPFAEAKETIGGYFLVSAGDLDEATRMAQACPNLKHGMIVEVREIGAMCHLAEELGLASMRG